VKAIDERVVGKNDRETVLNVVLLMAQNSSYQSTCIIEHILAYKLSNLIVKINP